MRTLTPEEQERSDAFVRIVLERVNPMRAEQGLELIDEEYATSLFRQVLAMERWADAGIAAKGCDVSTLVRWLSEPPKGIE